MFKMHSIVIGHKAGTFFCYLRHILLQNVMINIHKFEKNLLIYKEPLLLSSFSQICECLSSQFVTKCVLNNRKRYQLCVQLQWNPFWTCLLFISAIIVIPVISVMKWSGCYFFWFFVRKQNAIMWWT